MIVCIHSYRGGTGKSNITANLATLMACTGKRVGIVDCDIQSPGIHVLFGLKPETVRHTLNDFLWGRCAIEEAAHDVTDRLRQHPALPDGAALYLIPSSMKTGEITRILREGYDVNMLGDGYQEALDRLNLDVLFLDTHPGFSEDNLLSVAVADALVLVLRPDSQDYQGTAVAVEVAKRLDVPTLLIAVNKAMSFLDAPRLRDDVARAYGTPVAAVLPFSEDLLTLGSDGLFSLLSPDHGFTAGLKDVLAALATP